MSYGVESWNELNSGKDDIKSAEAILDANGVRVAGSMHNRILTAMQDYRNQELKFYKERLKQEMDSKCPNTYQVRQCYKLIDEI